MFGAFLLIICEVIMKKYLSFVLVLILLFSTLCGCSNKREWMNYDMADYVELVDCSAIEVDLKSDDFITHMDELIKSQLSSKSLTTTQKLTEGAVADGDTVNIAFVGKVDGVAFDGGTANSYDLVIGSNSFIDGFEDGLIGVQVGKTVDLNLKFPDPYQNSPDLAGKPVVFTVTVNSITRTTYPELNDEVATKLGYPTYDEFKEEMVALTVQDFAWNYVIKNSKILKQPEKEIGDMVDEAKNYYTQYATQQGTTLEAFLKQSGMTVEQFETTMTENAKNGFIDNYLLAYAIVDKYELVTEDAFNTELEKVASDASMSVDEIKKQNSATTIEREIYTTLAIEFIASKVVYKNQ